MRVLVGPRKLKRNLFGLLTLNRASITCIGGHPLSATFPWIGKWPLLRNEDFRHQASGTDYGVVTSCVLGQRLRFNIYSSLRFDFLSGTRKFDSLRKGFFLVKAFY